MIMLVCAFILGLVLVAATALHLLHHYLRLKHIPGPVGAAFYDVSRLSRYNSKNYGKRFASFHQVYGDVVRSGPVHVNLNKIEDIALVYRARILEEVCYSKGHFLGSQEVSHNQRENDDPLRDLVRTIRHQKIIDITTSLNFFADTVIDQLFDTEPTSSDFIAQTQTQFNSNSSLSASLEEILLRSPVSLLKRKRLSCYRNKDEVPNPSLVQDTKICAFKCPDTVSPTSVIAASVDSLKCTFARAFHFLLHNPEIMRKLRTEVDNLVGVWNRPNMPCPTDLVDAVYTDAVLNETLRLTLLQQDTGELRLLSGPLEISSKYIPRGTRISWNSYSFLTDESIFGNNSHEFGPERWLNTGKRRQSLMQKSLLPFSVCRDEYPKLDAGWLLLKRTVVVLLREFDIQLLQTERLEQMLNQMTDDSVPPATFARFRPRSSLQT